MIEKLDFLNKERMKSFGIEEFLEQTFKQFQDELILLRKTIYNYKDHHFVFALNERAWVGVFNNAIIKAFPDSSVTLQEYCVYDPQKAVGRADLLVHWMNNSNDEFYLLFEAKRYVESDMTSVLVEDEEYFKLIKSQGHKYFEAETEYYKNKIVYIIPISFGCIRNSAILEKAKTYFDPTQVITERVTDFCTLYFDGDFGVWVYGKVYDTKQL